MRDTLHSFQPHLFPAEIAFANSSSLNTKAILFEEVRPSPSPGGWPPGQRPEVVKGTPVSPTPHLQLLLPSFLAYKSGLGGRDALGA